MFGVARFRLIEPEIPPQVRSCAGRCRFGGGPAAHDGGLQRCFPQRICGRSGIHLRYGCLFSWPHMRPKRRAALLIALFVAVIAGLFNGTPEALIARLPEHSSEGRQEFRVVKGSRCSAREWAVSSPPF
jgi:hypothetical protein